MSASGPPEFQVRLRSRRVQRELSRLPEREQQRVVARLTGLAKAPRPPGCEKLSDNIYRGRVGDLRIIYFIDEANRRIEVGGIRRRTERTYKEIEELFP